MKIFSEKYDRREKFNVNHNLNTKNVIINVYSLMHDGWNKLKNCHERILDENNVEIKLNRKKAIKVVVMGE